MKTNYFKIGLLAISLFVIYSASYASTQVVDSMKPMYDLQLRLGNTAQSGTGSQLEIRHSAALGDNGFVGALQFDLSSVASKVNQIDSVVIRFTTQQKGGNVDIRPFAINWNEAGQATYSYAVLQNEITAAVAANNIATFTPNWPSKKIFEWDCTKSVNITNWQTKVNITEYVKSYLSTSTTDTVGFLLLPNVTSFSSTGTQFLTKDASVSTYGTSTTAGYDATCTVTGSTVTRWSRILDLLAVNGASESELYPELIVYSTSSVLTKLSSFGKGSKMNFDNVNSVLNITLNDVKTNSTVAIYNLTGKKVFGSDIISGSSRISMSNLMKGVYVVRLMNGSEITTLKIVK